MPNVETNTPLDHVLVRRLAFVRYLFCLAVRQSRQPEPLRAASLLMFHDAIELFLDLACTRLEVPHGKSDFEKLFGDVSAKLSDGKELSDRSALSRLNRARVSLKHYGTMPSSLDVEAYRASTASFLKSSTPRIFGVEFDAVSMNDLVADETARSLLHDAEREAAGGERQQAVRKYELAFREVVIAFERGCRESIGPSMFSFPISYLSGRLSDPSTEAAVADTRRAIEDLRRALRVVVMGIDMRRHRRFEAILERARHLPAKPPIVAEDTEFCRDFVVEVALELQQFLGESAASSAPDGGEPL